MWYVGNDEREGRCGNQNPSKSDDLPERKASTCYKSLYLGLVIRDPTNQNRLGAPPTRSPGQKTSQPDDIVNSIGSVCVRNHAYTVATKLQ